MISVIVPTNRIGGLDVLFDSLSQQTERNFELILVDNLFGRGRFGVADLEKRFRIKHVPPRENQFPYVQYCRTMNTGIAYAAGETLVFLCDYSWLAKDCLETHAEMQRKHRAPVHLDYNYSALPKLKEGLPVYNQDGFSPEADPVAYTQALNDTTDRYVADLESGKLDPFMLSIFEEALSEESVSALEVTYRHRPCSTREADDWNWMSCKNESMPTELLLALNGFDEAYDESHCYQDSELSYRLREAGVRWVNGPAETGMVTIVNPRPILNVKKLTKQIGWNKQLCDSDRAAKKRLAVNPGLSLRQWRKETIGK